MTEYYVEKEQFLTPVPADLRDIGVLVEPLTVAEKGLAQVWEVQRRLPWVKPAAQSLRHSPGHGLKAVVLGAGPVGILGTMALLARGFETVVYSRSPEPNPKAELVESMGATYLSSKSVSVEQLAERMGNIDLVYEAVGVAGVAYKVLSVLGNNGIFVFTGIPSPKPPSEVEADVIMRNLVLKNQVVLGTVNADPAAFQAAIRDLAVFKKRWPDAVRSLISGRYSINSYKELLLGDKSGIKNVIALV
jgi:threonine dehydrogenase-like Zn-dependent dehydrogenase